MTLTLLNHTLLVASLLSLCRPHPHPHTHPVLPPWPHISAPNHTYLGPKPRNKPPTKRTFLIIKLHINTHPNHKPTHPLTIIITFSPISFHPFHPTMLSSSFSTSSQQQSKPPRESKPDARGGAGSTSTSRWRTPGQQRVYNRRLLDALRAPARRPVSARAVKDAADSALALTARGQSRWSRAILMGRPNKVAVKARVKVRRKKPRKPDKKAKLVVSEPGEPSKERKVKERLRRLGQLVPGCRKLPAPSLLEEAVDYVPALEMQVKAMWALLAEALSATTLSPGPAEGEEGE